MKGVTAGYSECVELAALFLLTVTAGLVVSRITLVKLAGSGALDCARA